MNIHHYQRLLLHAFSKIEEGQLVVQLPDGTHRFFGNEQTHTQPIHLSIRHTDFFKKVILQEDIGLGESYIEKQWDCDDVAGFLKLLIRNKDKLSKGNSKVLTRLLQKTLLGWERVIHQLNSNNRKNSRRNIHAHYDLGNSFYHQFLDPTMTYSSAFFTHPEQDLESAQTEKYDRLCKKLGLKPNHHLLEIGSGWGGFAIHAATHYGCRVTTVTISEEQFAYVENRLKELGLEDQISLKFQDYRDLEGTYDRIASIEMLEAVGHEHLNTYFKTCQRLLSANGILAFQSILSADSRYSDYRNRVDYIRKHIFPGGHLPSFKSIHDAVGGCSNWDLMHMESFGTHYAETLRRWDTAFSETKEQRRALGFDEAFDRKWEFYFRYCEAGFDTRHIQVAQMVYSAPNNEAFNLENETLNQGGHRSNQLNVEQQYS